MLNLKAWNDNWVSVDAQISNLNITWVHLVQALVLGGDNEIKIFFQKFSIMKRVSMSLFFNRL